MQAQDAERRATTSSAILALLEAWEADELVKDPEQALGLLSDLVAREREDLQHVEFVRAAFQDAKTVLMDAQQALKGQLAVRHSLVERLKGRLPCPPPSCRIYRFILEAAVCYECH